MFDINTISLSGTLAEPPYVKSAADGAWTLVKLRLAVNVEKWRTNAETGEREQTEAANYFTLRVVGEKATATCERLAKGDRIAITGRVMIDAYTDQYGVKHTDQIIEARQVIRFNQ